MRIRLILPEDGLAIRQTYQRAFAGFPWYEQLTEDVVWARWLEYCGKSGFCGLVAVDRNLVVGGIWGDRPTVTELEAERGMALARFAERYVDGGSALCWIRETIVEPSRQNEGIGLTLREAFVELVHNDSGSTLFLTRVHRDNVPIIRLNQRMGFLPTGITVQSRTWPGVQHEYWYAKRSET